MSDSKTLDDETLARDANSSSEEIERKSEPEHEIEIEIESENENEIPLNRLGESESERETVRADGEPDGGETASRQRFSSRTTVRFEIDYFIISNFLINREIFIC